MKNPIKVGQNGWLKKVPDDILHTYTKFHGNRFIRLGATVPQTDTQTRQTYITSLFCRGLKMYFL